MSLHFNLDLEIVVITAANERDTRAVVLHKYKDGSLKAVAHTLCSLLLAEKSYSQIEGGALQSKDSINLYMEEGSICRQTTAHYYQSKDQIKGIPTHTANRLPHWETSLLQLQDGVFAIKKIGTCWWFVMVNTKI